MLEVRNVTKIYNSGRSAFKALDDVSINFGGKGLVVVLGKSGCGKSTLLNIIGGLDTPTRGEVIINGRSTKSFKRSDYDAYRNTFVGIVFQEFNLIDEISVFDNINMTMKLQEKNADVNTVDEALAMVGLANLGYRKPSELSGGQRQRVALARALLKKPEIILADEPTGALDSVTSEEVFETLKRIAQSKLVIVVTHNRDLAHAYADRIVEIVDGQIVADRVRDVENSDGVKELEGGVIEVGAGGKLTAEQLNARLKKGQINYIGLSHEKDRIALAYPETVDGFYEAQNQVPYKTTEEKDIKTDFKEFKLSKGGLTFKDSFKLAREGTKRSKKRYRFLMWIMSICFTMFSLALIVGMVSLPSIVAKSAFDDGAQPLVVTGYMENEYGYRLSKLDDAKISELRDIMGEEGACARIIYTSPEFTDLDNNILSNTSDWDGQYQAGVDFTDSGSFSFDCFNTVIDIDDISALGLKTVAGKSACSDMSEIIISDFAAYVMTRRGIVGYDSGGEFGIVFPKTVEDVVGCRIKLMETGKFYTIAGIFETDYEKYKSIIGASEFDPDASKLSSKLLSNSSYLYRAMIGKEGFGQVLSSQKPKNSSRSSFTLSETSGGYGSYNSLNSSNYSYDKEEFQKNLLWSASGENNDVAPESLASGEVNEIIVSFDAVRNLLNMYDIHDYEQFVNSSEFKSAMAKEYYFKLDYNYNTGFDEIKVKIVGVTSNYGVLYLSDALCEQYSSVLSGYDLMYFGRGATRTGLQSKLSSLQKNGLVYGTATASLTEMQSFNETLDTMGKVFFYIALAMLVLAFFIILNYMTASIRFRTKEIAVYRVIGAKTFDVAKIFLTEGGFIVVKTTIISIILSFILSLIINSVMSSILAAFGLAITIVNFNWLVEPIVILLGSALTVLISSIIPIMRVCGKKPVEAVKMI